MSLLLKFIMRFFGLSSIITSTLVYGVKRDGNFDDNFDDNFDYMPAPEPRKMMMSASVRCP